MQRRATRLRDDGGELAVPVSDSLPSAISWQLEPRPTFILCGVAPVHRAGHQAYTTCLASEGAAGVEDHPQGSFQRHSLSK
jgi:hypothetical protein